MDERFSWFEVDNISGFPLGDQTLILILILLLLSINTVILLLILKNIKKKKYNSH